MQFGAQDVESISSDEILTFLSRNTTGQKPSTKRHKYATLKTFFNFIENIESNLIVNPCETAMLRKTFRIAKIRRWNILEKDTVDEMIFKTDNQRDRLMLELMARGGMRIGEVLKIRVKDVDERRLFILHPKSGRQSEIVFIPQKVADRLKDHIRRKDLQPEQRVFSLGYTCVSMIVKRAGKKIGIEIRPHDLRRHAATYASRSGVPLEIVSKVILRHANLATTQRYLGKVSDTEAIRWIENIHG